MWFRIRDRLQKKHLLLNNNSAISTRIPGSNLIWFGLKNDDAPVLIDLYSNLTDASESSHQVVYRLRQDICAIASAHGHFGQQLHALTGTMPGVFDEQIRHLGCLRANNSYAETERNLRHGTNLICIDNECLVLGMTAERLMLNAELFEKCATACTLAYASGKTLTKIPWIIRYLALGRLRKDQKNARKKVARGDLPDQSVGY